ncbi:hypothetical protein C8F04DRAFT_1193835 [Mycena alexandri]|uniref:Uncharacterized protein n=1 Tax=Mycena alexandri TaxID=1745969 RepID=A0AAD6WVT4_9AGAR|nr:hypothetical protein C8F04DRAFT_1193835 [Mycena alexandri]
MSAVPARSQHDIRARGHGHWYEVLGTGMGYGRRARVCIDTVNANGKSMPWCTCGVKTTEYRERERERAQCVHLSAKALHPRPTSSVLGKQAPRLNQTRYEVLVAITKWIGWASRRGGEPAHDCQEFQNSVATMQCVGTKRERICVVLCCKRTSARRAATRGYANHARRTSPPPSTSLQAAANQGPKGLRTRMQECYSARGVMEVFPTRVPSKPWESEVVAYCGPRRCNRPRAGE